MIPWASDIHNCHVLGSPSLSGGQKNSFIYPTKAGHLHYNVVLKSKFHHRSALLLIAVFQISLFALLLISGKKTSNAVFDFFIPERKLFMLQPLHCRRRQFSTNNGGRGPATADGSPFGRRNGQRHDNTPFKKAFIKLCRWTSPSL